MMPVNTKQPVAHWTRVGLTVAGASLAVIVLAASVDEARALIKKFNY